MKKSIVVILGILATSLASAQEKVGNVVYFPNIDKLYYTDKPADGSSVADSNIGQFFAEWEGWSQLVSKGAEPSVYNAYFERYFQTFQDKLESATGRYLLLDQRVQVAKYDCNIGPETHPEWDFFSFAAYYLEPESISFFTPVVKSEKKVLYLNPEAKEVVSSFLDEPVMTSDGKNGPGIIREYLDVSQTHWGRSWVFGSPHEIFVGKDGFYVTSMRTSGYDIIFFPWDGEPDVDSIYFVQ